MPCQAGRRGAGRRDLMRWLAAAGLAAPRGQRTLLQAATALAQTPNTAARCASPPNPPPPPTRWTRPEAPRPPTTTAPSLFNGLTRLDGKLVPHPELAESITNEAAKVWTFKLRQGVTFHDGSKLTPADVIYTLNRIKDPNNGSSARALATQMTEITADGHGAVRITLAAPNADLPVILGTPHFMIVKDGTTDFKKANGTGPFTVKEFTPGVRSIGVRNPNYWKPGQPYLDEVEIFSIEDETARLNAMLSGDIQVASQITPRSASRVKASPASRSSKPRPATTTTSSSARTPTPPATPTSSWPSNTCSTANRCRPPSAASSATTNPSTPATATTTPPSSSAPTTPTRPSSTSRNQASEPPPSPSTPWPATP